MPENSPYDPLTTLIDALIATDHAIGDARLATLSPDLTAMLRKDPSEWQALITEPTEQILHAALRATYPTAKHPNALSTLYAHYTFFEAHLSALFEQTEGRVACADKAFWILGHYRQYVLTDALPEDAPDPRPYWIPKQQSPAWWMQVCGHLDRLYYGDPRPYVSDWHTLLGSRPAHPSPEKES